MKRILVIALALLLLCGCAEIQSPGVTGFGSDKILAAERDMFFYDVEFRQAEHGEDYVIEWEDPAVELYLRKLLNKPEGELRHSDVWNIQLLQLTPTLCKAWEELPVGAETFSDRYGTDEVEMEIVDLSEFEIPLVQSLEDLKHFDSLQIFYLSDHTVPVSFELDLAPLTHCQNLRVLMLHWTAFPTLAPLAQLPGLENVYLEDCGTLDLTPLENHPTLSVLRVNGCTLPSLEPITSMPKLRYLGIGFETAYPSLEPLTRSAVEYLNIDLSADGRELFAQLDYDSISRIPELVCLSLTNHTHLTLEQCTRIVEGCPKLRYLDIRYTGAADEIKTGGTLDVSRLEGFVCTPYHS